MIVEKNGGALLLRQRRSVLGINEDVAVEEGQTHRRSCFLSRLNFQPFESPIGCLDISRNSCSNASRSDLPASCSRYSRTSWLTLLPIASARRRAFWRTSSFIDSVKFINT